MKKNNNVKKPKQSKRSKQVRKQSNQKQKGMNKTSKTSCSLTLRMGAFGSLFVVLCSSFTPFIAFFLTVLATIILSKA
ncbi:hypothetical protein [Pseudoalteromonas sp. B530]|uniref:hypothetical protein n=1 Tax=Pseudoalteromonas sp. B530 TaxID=2994390 RepID=UPI00224A8239|nr:hypothetical protein [Pseudoalteromonas sp. B530]MCX2765451.1 hypothetical protein [Pseudoalteromonas sp. B530]MCX2765462.1 hypothetical protein [Pseudoalteromonas sp. B530]